MSMLPKNKDGCPYLILAPMEGVADRTFRMAMASVGGFDEACAEFLRVPANAHIESLSRRYDPHETAPIPQAAQIMGGEPSLMAEMTWALAAQGAPRIDLNCGCPSNTVTGKGAGSSLLKDPSHLHAVAKAMVEAASVPVTAKLRSGFEDTSLFKENILAAQESGIAYLTLHPRTKVDGYGPPARWDLIAEAKQTLTIPVVGNGDILVVEDALRMQAETNCDALMIGRGSVINPWLFHEIKAHFANTIAPEPNPLQFVKWFISHLSEDVKMKSRVSKLKQLGGYLFKKTPALLEKRQDMLRQKYESPEQFLEWVTPLLRS